MAQLCHLVIGQTPLYSVCTGEPCFNITYSYGLKMEFNCIQVYKAIQKELITMLMINVEKLAALNEMTLRQSDSISTESCTFDHCTIGASKCLLALLCISFSVVAGKTNKAGRGLWLIENKLILLFVNLLPVC